jgi:Raf kinase inhibitor-like YbhB/YbcL family protein
MRPGISLFALLLLAIAPLSRAGSAFQITSPDFSSGGFIPAKFTADGENVPPALKIAGVPAAAKSLALIVDDPDAPAGTFTHWLLWNIPPASLSLDGQTPGVHGTNQFGKTSYSGPKPPSGTHRYFFRLSALDTRLALPAGATREDLDAAMQGHIIATAILMGRYAHGAQ